ncbi:hypothetical protein C5167_000519 [Papaver somniferum]|uniref:BHLH domain-containing protein n=1 Tax=Papaver somniferum TaxID=3469 RepID=A0A4Y7KSW5_PAPSO|nr:transcription factor bHLH162-like [Papaver somniferum]RZC76443.1 hypothetical protein C5167_000519 [Papaver somniferum]
MKNSSKCASSSSTCAAAAIDRETIEKNRRSHMKALCFKLVSLIPPTTSTHDNNHSSKKIIHIQELTKRIDKLKRKKDLLTATTLPNTDHCGDQDIITTNAAAVVAATSTCSLNTSTEICGNDLLDLPILQVRNFDSTTLEVVLITGMNKQFLYYQLITVLEEEGAEIVNASFATVDDKIFYTVHSQVTSYHADNIFRLVVAVVY